MNALKTDPKVADLIKNEKKRQSETLQLIPSENYTSAAVRKALSSVTVHKYSEGQVGARMYEGNEYIDEIEALCKKRALKVFDLKPVSCHVNVQAHAGSIANLAVYNALLKPGDRIMGMYLFDGGHLSHGWEYKGKSVSMTSKIYEVAHYHVHKETEVFDYDEIKELVQNEKPQMLISGGTAYPRTINHKKLSQIAQDVNAYYLADIAHEAGLIAGKAHPSPFAYADVVTMTTHKTLRGPKGALIYSKKKFKDAIDRSVFPGIQGGPMNNNIAAIAVCLKEANTKEFQTYVKQVIKNAHVLAYELTRYNFRLVSGGTDKHLLLIDLSNKILGGKYVARALHIAGMTTNKNTIPNEAGTPLSPSGIRLGTPAVTTRGMKAPEMKYIAYWIDKVITAIQPLKHLSFDNFEEQVLSWV